VATRTHPFHDDKDIASYLSTVQGFATQLPAATHFADLQRNSTVAT
jgi:hypothetical protein